MSEWQFDSTSVEETQRLAQELVGALNYRGVIGLVGDLGMGKTHFVQGLARAMGIPPTTEVVSPTYAIVNDYRGSDDQILLHMDFYRLVDEDSAYALGIEEQLHQPNSLVAIEWADRLPELLPAESVWLHFEWVSETERRIKVRGIDNFLKPSN